LLLASHQYLDKLREFSKPKHDEYIKGLYSADQRALEQVTKLIGG
jgi:hypothetical protein